MAAVQTTIPFKSRKKAYARNAKGKTNVGNVNIFNTGELRNTNKLKRRIEDRDCIVESDFHNGKLRNKNLATCLN